MTDYIQRKPTKEEKEARRAQKAAQQEKERLKKIANIPDSVHGIPVIEVSYTAVGKNALKNYGAPSEKKEKPF